MRMRGCLSVVLLSIVFLVSGCTSKVSESNESYRRAGTYTVRYAKGFRVEKFVGFTRVRVINPWDSSHILHTYILVDKSKPLPAHLPKGTLLRTPLTKVAAYSTIHCTTLNALEALNIVKGVCEPDYINIPAIQQGVKDHRVVSLGMADNPNIEKILMMSPEAVFATPIVGRTYGKLSKAGIPIIETISYTESDPLARAEWIRYYSLFLNKEQLGDSIFSTIADNYNRVKREVANVSFRPSVFTDLRYRNSWNMPGGHSFMARMLMDAGASYPWANNPSTTYLSLSFESVLDKAGTADIWLIKYFDQKHNLTYSGIADEYKPYTYFDAYRKKHVYACNTAYSSYYEDLPIRPDRILKDMAAVFHPELFPDYKTFYFKHIEH